MKMKMLIALFVVPFFTVGQSQVFKNMVASLDLTTDTCTAIQPVNATSDAYDFTIEGSGRLEKLVLSEFMEQSKKDALKESRLLTNIARAASTAWYGSQYADRKKWRSLEKYFQRANHQLVSGFNILKTTSFRIPLLEAPREGYYYDRSGAEGELNLYKGSRPKSKEEKEAEKIPLRFYTEKELVALIVKNTHRGGFYRGIRKGVFQFVGVSITVDERSLFKNKIPTARVVLTFGAKRLLRVKA